MNLLNFVQMKKTTLLLLLLYITTFAIAQDNTRPSKSRFWLNKASTFQVKPGDILVYQLEDSGQQFDLLVTIKKFGETISFDFNIPGRNKKGSVTIQSNAIKSTSAYNLNFNNSKTASGKSSLWLSKANFRDLTGSDKQTRMDLGAGTEVFTRTSTSTQKINFKGREKIITMYNVSDNGTSGTTFFSVLNDLDNPLIINMKGEMKITLKEVR
jgi:hypothetical protein